MLDNPNAYPIRTKTGLVWLRCGNEVLITYGARGTQRAVIVNPRPTAKGRVQVKKFRANSGRWTTPVYIHFTQILEVCAP